ncbi:MAG TPA: hemerythrin domain-containing protein [Pyrinomonadaceae bacterium]|jgi:hemerythrin-like domain-containing protein|nr:hemerythrin domain-containing protein [Pyrinomonadaceae bacterium]
MNAIELLKADHDKVSLLFQKVKAEEGDKKQLFDKIKAELDVHTHIEETIFYPYLLEKGDEKLQDITKEGIEEHHQAKMFLREIPNLADDSDKLDPKLQVLMEDITHHVQEEEGEMFPMCEKQFDAEKLEELGKQMEEEKKNFKAKASAASSS